jgi:hypothetical protein
MADAVTYRLKISAAASLAASLIIADTRQPASVFHPLRTLAGWVRFRDPKQTLSTVEGAYCTAARCEWKKSIFQLPS